MITLQLTAQSAWSTLHICDRKARRDVATVAYGVIALVDFTYTVARSRKAVETYRMAWMMVLLVWALLLALVAESCHQFRRFMTWQNEFVASCLEAPVTEVAELQPTAPLPDSDPVSDVAPEPLADVSDLLAIASPDQRKNFLQLPDCTLVAVAKLEGLKIAKKWSYRRQLRAGERRAVLDAVA